MELFNNFKKDQLGQVMAKGAEKGLPAWTLQFHWRDGSPSIDQIFQMRSEAPADVQVDAITGRAIVPCALDIDTAWSQLARRLGAFNIALNAPDGKALGYQAIVYDGPAKTTFKNKHSFVVRVDPAIIRRLDSLLAPSALRRRARIVVYALERLADDLQRQLANIGHGVSRVHIESASQLPNAKCKHLLVRCERSLYDRIMRLAGGTNSAIVERAMILLMHEAATATGPIIIRRERIDVPRKIHKDDAAQQVEFAIAMAKQARAYSEQAGTA